MQLEQILHKKAWDIVTSINDPPTPIIILGKDFEATLKVDYESTKMEQAPTYEKIEEEAHNIIKPVSKNQAKGLIARYIARRIHSFMPDYAPQFVKRIAEIVKEELGFY